MNTNTSISPLVRAIGRWSLFALIVNSVLGSGIFGLPSSIAKLVGIYAMWAYVAGALVACVIVAIVVELSSQFERAGGAYLYVHDAFGQLIGIQTGWFSWLARVTTAAAITNLLITYLRTYIPNVNDPIPRCVGIFLLIGSLTVLNIVGVRFGAWVSSAFTVAKLIPLLTLIIFGIAQWSTTVTTKPLVWIPSAENWVDSLIAMVFAYSGFESAMIPGGEMKNPRRDVPIAAFAALFLIAVLYISLHLVVIHVLPNMASTETPLSDAAAIYAGVSGRTVITLGAIISTFGWLSAAVVTAPRLTFAMAQGGDFPAFCGLVHPRFRTPWTSILLWASLVMGLAMYGNFIWNVFLSVAARLVVYSTMCAAAIRLRSNYPERDAWRAPFGAICPIAGIMICLTLATRFKLEHLLVMLSVGVAGIITFLYNRKR